MSNLIAIGVGGTGAKLVEALIHLSASGHSPDTIYPILIDQDLHNGNVQRTKKVIQQYKILNALITPFNSQSIFNSELRTVHDELLPLVPENINNTFDAAIEYASMSSDQKLVVKALYTEDQRAEILDKGYKKRAHMGSVLMQRLIHNQRLLQDTSPGLNMIVSKIKNVDSPKIIIGGSIFGGTGASGITNLGKYLRAQIPNGTISAIMMLPYFVVSDSHVEGDPDAGLVRSDTDMQLVKVALEIYKNEIDRAFHNVFLVGSQIDRIVSDLPTETAIAGGEAQENPAHIFELLAVSGAISKSAINTSATYWRYNVDNNDAIPPFTFRELPRELNDQKFRLLSTFAELIIETDKYPLAWKKRQPWYIHDHDQKHQLYSWAQRYLSWSNELSNKGSNGHVWKRFNYYHSQLMPIEKLGALLSVHCVKHKSISLGELIQALNDIAVSKFD